MHLDQHRTLLVFLSLLGRPLFWPGDRDTAFLRYHPHRFGKRAFLHFHHEAEHVAALATSETMENLFYGMHRKRRCLFSVKRAEPGEILPALLQPDVLPNDPDNVRLLLHALRNDPASAIRYNRKCTTVIALPPCSSVSNAIRSTS